MKGDIIKKRFFKHPNEDGIKTKLYVTSLGNLKQGDYVTFKLYTHFGEIKYEQNKKYEILEIVNEDSKKYFIVNGIISVSKYEKDDSLIRYEWCLERVKEKESSDNSTLKRPLQIHEEHINTLREDRIHCQSVLDYPDDHSERDKRIKKCFISSLTSSASNDILEEQLSKILGVKNIDTKHGWDGIDETTNEPYEYKPTKITTRNYLGANVNINDDSEDKINNISPNKKGYHNHKAHFVIAIMNKDTSEWACIYNFKESILYDSRMEYVKESIKLQRKRTVYGTNIKKCIELSEKYNEPYNYWENPKFFPKT